MIVASPVEKRGLSTLHRLGDMTISVAGRLTT